jgi:hypothetical protein
MQPHLSSSTTPDTYKVYKTHSIYEKCTTNLTESVRREFISTDLLSKDPQSRDEEKIWKKKRETRNKPDNFPVETHRRTPFPSHVGEKGKRNTTKKSKAIITKIFPEKNNQQRKTIRATRSAR